MRRITALLLTVLLLFASAACAEGTHYVMAGFDSEASGHIWNDNMFFLRMEEQTGLLFDFQQYQELDAWRDALNFMRDGKQAMPDVLFKAQLTPAQMLELYDAGMIIDLKPYLAEHAPNLTALFAAHPEWERACTLPGGQIVALPGINELQNNNAIWINTEWLAAVGKEMPTTADEFIDVLRAFKTGDPNRNGKRDETPLTFTSLWDLRFLGSAFGLCANDYYLTLGEGGTVTFAADSAQMRSFVEWLHLLWDENLIDHYGFSALDSTRAITDSKATITYGVVFGPSVMSMLPSTAAASYRVLMPMTYEGQAIYRDLLGDVMPGAFAVTSACADPAAMVAWADFLYSPEGEMLAQVGREGVDYTVMSDGKWAWLDDPATVAGTVLSDVVIIGGGDMPGYATADFQLRYDDPDTHAAVEQLYALKQVSRIPYPTVYLSKDAQSRVTAIWSTMGPYIERSLVHFVTGDTPINDETWAAYCDELSAQGRDEFVAIWQDAVN